MSRKKDIYIILIICFINAFLFTFILYPLLENPFDFLVDGEGYHSLALNLSTGKGLFLDKGVDPLLPDYERTTLLRPPLYPLLLSGIYSLFGVHLEIVQLIHIILSTLTCLIVFIIAREIYNKKVALVSSVIFAFNPLIFWHIPRLYNENLFIFILAFSMLYIVKLFQKLSFKTSMIAGALIGIASLCKGQMFILPFFLLPGLFYTFPEMRGKVLKCFFTLFFMMIVIISPWTLRNYHITHKFVPVQCGLGVHFLRGNVSSKYNFGLKNNSHAEAMRIAFEKERNYIERYSSKTNRKPNEMEVNELFNKLSIESVKNEPIEFIKKIFTGILAYWYLGGSQFKSVLIAIINLPMLLLACLGLFYSIKCKTNIIPLLLLILYFTLIHAVILAIARYSVPIMPYVIIFASFGIINLYEKLKEKTRGIFD